MLSLIFKNAYKLTKCTHKNFVAMAKFSLGANFCFEWVKVILFLLDTSEELILKIIHTWKFKILY